MLGVDHPLVRFFAGCILALWLVWVSYMLIDVHSIIARVEWIESEARKGDRFTLDRGVKLESLVREHMVEHQEIEEIRQLVRELELKLEGERNGRD